jgi:hypothetical protein
MIALHRGETRMRGNRDRCRKPLPAILLGAGLARTTLRPLAVAVLAMLVACHGTDARHRDQGSGEPIILD